MEAVPLRPKTAVPRIDEYLTWLPGPPALVAAVRVCGEGLNLWGCLVTVKLPLASDAVPTTVPLRPPTEIAVVIDRKSVV